MKITLCGSTRFKEAWLEWNKKLTLAGHVVYTVAWFSNDPKEVIPPTDDEKIMLDLVHLRKIEESDMIFVLDVDNYFGFSTRREIAWARMHGKNVMFLSSGDGQWLLSTGTSLSPQRPPVQPASKERIKV